jgi:hypothetical protein
MTWRFLGVRLDPSAAERFVQNVTGAAEDVVQIVEHDPLKAAAAIAAAVVMPEVISWVGTELLTATEVVTGVDYVAAVDAINSVTGLTGAQAANMVGQAAFTAASTGGDLSKTLQTVLTNATGIYVDSTITDAFDSKLAGSVVRAATLASLNDKDVGQAVGLQLIPASVGAAVGTILKNVGSTVDDFLFPNDEFSFEYDRDADIFETYIPTTGDVVVAPEQIYASPNVNVDESAFQKTNFDPDAEFSTDDGSIVNVKGEVNKWSAEGYATNIKPNEQGDFVDPNNKVILTLSEAKQILAANDAACAAPAGSWKTVAGLGAVCLSPQQAIADEIQKRVASQTERTVIPSPGSANRPAALPIANPNGVKMPDAVGWAAAGEAITRSVANALTIIKQLENGTYRPGATSPYGTPRPPIPGFPVTNRDGSVTVNNGNGTQTTTYPNGQKVTMSTSTVPSNMGGGVSTNTLLLVGAGLAAALLLRRK